MAPALAGGFLSVVPRGESDVSSFEQDVTLLEVLANAFFLSTAVYYVPLCIKNGARFWN